MVQTEKDKVFNQLQKEILNTNFESIEELDDYLDDNIFLIKNGEEPEIDLGRISKFYKRYNLAVKEIKNYWRHIN